ncbi:hypothetical protein [Halobaculum rubrum]|uniref:hypothetical protein n=1 Tax=Halobaculum rubrum TaxID=2872158 RepID=UPI001CA44176|nr:hypothetical protein [Halobaculum rubrum]QZX98831.1 hypothetical protein K6T25_11185 [Halobaculum rubrum]
MTTDGRAGTDDPPGGSDEPTVPIVCEECDTRTRVPLSELADQLRRHNETRHDGEDVAGVEPALADRIADLAAEDMGLLDGE